MDDISLLDLAVLASLAQAEEPRHAAGLLPEIHYRLERPVNRGAVARALFGLQARGWAARRRGKPSSHGGPRRALYSITKRGQERLEQHLQTIERVARVRSLSPAARKLLLNPPPESKTAQAKRYGVDLVHLARALLQSPQERYREAIETINSFRRLSI